MVWLEMETMVSMMDFTASVPFCRRPMESETSAFTARITAVEKSGQAAGAQDGMITQASKSCDALSNNVQDLMTNISEIDEMLNNLSEANSTVFRAE